MKNKRRKFTADQKLCILKKSWIDKQSVADICEENQVRPTLFYRWQKEFFEGAISALERNPNRSDKAWQKKITNLEEKLARKHEVLSEVMEEFIALKKSDGET